MFSDFGRDQSRDALSSAWAGPEIRGRIMIAIRSSDFFIAYLNVRDKPIIDLIKLQQKNEPI